MVFKKGVFNAALPLVVVIFLLFISIYGKAGEPYSMHAMKNTIAVKGSPASPKVVCHVEVTGQSHFPNAAVDLFYTRLQQFSRLQVFFRKHKNDSYHKLETEVAQADLDDPMVITGVKRKMVFLPFPTEFKICFELRSNDLMLASLYNSFNPSAFDSVCIEYKIGKAFALVYKIDGDAKSIKILENKKNTSFTFFPKHKPMYYYYPAKPAHLFEPLHVMLRTLVVPKAFKDKPEDYFAQWYHSFTQNTSTLDPHSKHIFDELCMGMTDSLEITRTIFQFIREKINYIGLFSGWDAFIPRDVNLVLANRYGDCKNMAHLLCSALRYKGIEAYYGITASSNFQVDMDFPGLSSGDHAICVARTGESWYFLDATYKSDKSLVPSPFIQGRNVLVVNEKNAFYKRVPVVNPQNNTISDSVELDFTQIPYKINWLRTSTGYNASVMNELELAVTEQEQYAYLKWMFELISKNLNFSELSFHEEAAGTNKIKAAGIISDNVLQNLPSGQKLLFPDFIMYPKMLESSNFKYEIRNQYCYRNEGNYRLLLPGNGTPEKFVSDSLSNRFMHFSYSTASPAKNVLDIKVVFELKELTIPVSDLEAFDDFSKKVFNILHHAILLQ